MIETEALIIGGGLAGLACASECVEQGTPFLLIEPRSYVGGLCSTWSWDGFTLDFGPHIFCAQATDEAKAWFRRYVPDCHERLRNDSVLVDGTEYLYPIQSRRSLAGWISCDYSGPIRSYREYVLANFGRRLMDAFFAPWNEKEYKCSLCSLDAKLLGGRSPDPDAPQATYLYPTSGGMAGLADALYTALPAGSVLCKNWVEHLNPTHRTAVLADAERIKWRHVVWCAPLTELGKVLPAREPDWRFDLLRWRTIVLVNVFLGRRLPIEWLALYTPQPDVPFHRLALPRVLSAGNVPDGKDCIQAEVSVKGGLPFDLQGVESATVAGLRKLVYLNGSDEPTVWSRVVDVGYPVPLLATRKLVAGIGDGLAEQGIHLCGRAGEWRHMNMWTVVDRARETIGGLSADGH